MEFYQEGFGVILLLLADKVYKTSALERSFEDSFDLPHYYTDATFPPRVDVSLYLLLLGHLLQSLPVFDTCSSRFECLPVVHSFT